MPLDLNNIRLVTFDVFGTLLDWRSYVEGYFPSKFLHFARLSEAHQADKGSAQFSYASMLKAVAYELNPGMPAAQLDRFADGFGTAPAFADANALHDLRLLAQLGCVSNSDMTHQQDAQRGLGLHWDVCLAAEQLRAWKPDARAWDAALNHVTRELGFELSQWLHVSAFSFYDLDPCRQRGIHTCFVPRPGAGSARDAELSNPDLVVSDLFDLVSRMQAAKDGPWRYRVKATCVDGDTAENFLRWMRYEHGADLLRVTGCAEFRAFRISDVEVNCEYLFTTRRALDRYLGGVAQDLRKKGREMFSEAEVAFERDETRLACQGVSRKKRDFA